MKQTFLGNQGRNWLLAVVYVLSIYATLGLVPTPVSFLRSHGLLRLTLSILFALCWLGILSLLAIRTRSLWRFIAMAALAALYVLITHQVQIPEEQIHFVQYGLVGVLFVRAFRPTLKHEGKSYLAAFVLAILVGWLDEVLQGYLPNRHYDVRDILLNTVSAFMGLCVYRVIPHQKMTDK